MSWISFVPVICTTLLFILQIIFGMYLLSDISQIEIFAYCGVALYVLSGVVFGMLPVIEFRKQGRVKTGKSYIHTTHLVDTGIYAIVPHPQYVTFILWAFAGMLLFQHWMIILLGLPILLLTYLDLLKADKNAIEKFGKEYQVYMKHVPRTNFLLGIIRLLREKNGLDKI